MLGNNEIHFNTGRKLRFDNGKHVYWVQQSGEVPCDNDFEVYRELDGAIQKWHQQGSGGWG